MAHVTLQEIADMAHAERLQKQVDLMRELSTFDGFHKKWFSNLGQFKTRLECFNWVNALHNEAFGYEKYADYNSFKAVVSRKQKQNG